MTHIKVQNKTIKNPEIIISLKNKHHGLAQNSEHNLFNVRSKRITFLPERTRIKNIKTTMLFAVSETPVTLKQGQGHPTWYESLHAKPGHNHAKFESLAVKQRPKRSHIKPCVESGKLPIITVYTRASQHK